MSSIFTNIFTPSDYLQMSSLSQRVVRSHVLNSNVANAETPGYRALGYAFEEQLQSLVPDESRAELNTSSDRHKKHAFSRVDGTLDPDVYIRPTESVSNDGNTVNVDEEMAQIAKNQILYRTAVECLTRKIGVLRYAINGGR